MKLQKISEGNEQIHYLPYMPSQPSQTIAFNSARSQQKLQKPLSAVSSPNQSMNLKNTKLSNNNDSRKKLSNQNKIEETSKLKCYSERRQFGSSDGGSLNKIHQVKPTFAAFNLNPSSQLKQKFNENQYEITNQTQIVDPHTISFYPVCSIYQPLNSNNSPYLFSQQLGENASPSNSLNYTNNFSRNNNFYEHQQGNNTTYNNSNMIGQRYQQHSEIEQQQQDQEECLNNQIRSLNIMTSNEQLRNQESVQKQQFEQGFVSPIKLSKQMSEKQRSSEYTLSSTNDNENKAQMQLIIQYLEDINKYVKDSKSSLNQSQTQILNKEESKKQQLQAFMSNGKKKNGNFDVEEVVQQLAVARESESQINNQQRLNQIITDQEESQSSKMRVSSNTQLEKSGQIAGNNNSNDNNNQYSTNSSIKGKKENSKYQKEISQLKEENNLLQKEKANLKEQIILLEGRISLKQKFEEERSKFDDIIKKQQQIILLNYETIKQQSDDAIYKQQNLSQGLIISQKQINDLQAIIKNQLDTINQLQVLLKEKDLQLEEIMKSKQNILIKQSQDLIQQHSVMVQSREQQQQAIDQKQIELPQKDEKIEEFLKKILNFEEIKGNQEKAKKHIEISEETIKLLNKEITELNQVKQQSSIPYQSKIQEYSESKDSCSMSVADPNKLLRELQEKINENVNLGIKNDELKEQLKLAQKQIKQLEQKVQAKEVPINQQQCTSNVSESTSVVDPNKLLQELQDKINENVELRMKIEELKEQLKQAKKKIQDSQQKDSIKEESVYQESSSMSIADPNKLLQELQDKINENGELGIKIDELKEQLKQARKKIQELEIQFSMKESNIQLLLPNMKSQDKLINKQSGQNHKEDCVRQDDSSKSFKKRLEGQDELDFDEFKIVQVSEDHKYQISQRGGEIQQKGDKKLQALNQPTHKKEMKAVKYDKKQIMEEDAHELNDSEVDISKSDMKNNNLLIDSVQLSLEEMHKQLNLNLTSSQIDVKQQMSLLEFAESYNDDHTNLSQKKKEHEVINDIAKMMNLNFKM